MVWQFSWLEYLPVTQGVAGSSPVHTAKEFNLGWTLFFVSLLQPQNSISHTTSSKNSPPIIHQVNTHSQCLFIPQTSPYSQATFKQPVPKKTDTHSQCVFIPHKTHPNDFLFFLNSPIQLLNANRKLNYFLLKYNYTLSKK